MIDLDKKKKLRPFTIYFIPISESLTEALEVSIQFLLVLSIQFWTIFRVLDSFGY